MADQKGNLPAIKCCNCGKTLFFGRIVEGEVSKKCKCGTINYIGANNEIKNVGRSFQDRLQLTTK